MPIPSVSPTGVTAIETMLGAVTVSEVLWLTLPRRAEILVVPLVSELAKPVALIVATEVVEELHVTRLVRSELLPSLYAPVAVNCWLVLTGIDEAAGAIVIDFKFTAAAVTESWADA